MNHDHLVDANDYEIFLEKAQDGDIKISTGLYTGKFTEYFDPFALHLIHIISRPSLLLLSLSYSGATLISLQVLQILVQFNIIHLLF